MIKTALRAPFFMAKLHKMESDGYVNHTVDSTTEKGSYCLFHVMSFLKNKLP